MSGTNGEKIYALFRLMSSLQKEIFIVYIWQRGTAKTINVQLVSQVGFTIECYV